MATTLRGLAERAIALAAEQRRLIGITGPPGAGKSSLARRLCDQLEGSAAIVPMDGFHLRNADLARLGLAERKGAPDTFDVDGFVAALQELRAGTGPVVLPSFDRVVDEPIERSITVPVETRIILVEGNYLLHNEHGWEHVSPLIDESWFLEPPDALRLERLLARHIDFGKAVNVAAEWVSNVDENNAALIRSGRSKATLVVSNLVID